MMEEIIKLLEEHNIKCVRNGNDLSLSHKNFYVNIENVKFDSMSDNVIKLKNKKVVVNIFYNFEHIHITVL